MMGQFAQQLAANIVASMKKSFERGDPVLTDEKHFGHLDLPAYRRVVAAMHADGFSYIADIACPETDAARTSILMRTMLSADGKVLAAYYQFKPDMNYVGAVLLRDIRACKPIAAVTNALRSFRVLHCMDVETEFDDGRQLITTNAGDVFAHEHPTIESKYFPVDTPVSTLLVHHLARIAAIGREGHHPTVVRTADDILKFQLRQKKSRIAHREAIGWIT